MRDAVPDPTQTRSARLRVLVSSYRSAPHVGGQGVYVRALSRALADQGCEVSVISGPPYPDLDPDIGLIELPSLDLFSVDNAFLQLRWKTLFDRADRTEWLSHNTGAFAEMISYAIRLEAWVAQHGDQFDVIHDNQTLALAMAGVDQYLPVITTLHHPIAIDRDFAVAGAANWWRRALTRRWHSFVDHQAKAARALPRFLAVSDAARQSYARHCGVDPDKVRVAFNGLDLDSFKPDPTVERDTDHVLALASADVPIKGLDVLIDAMARLKARGRTPRVTVIGQLRDGPTKRALIETGLLDSVEFVSGLSLDEIVALYRKATVFVSASRFEGFGFPAAEAMACGAPVIVSRGGALPEVAGEAGIVTEVEDADGLADALERVLSDPELQQQMSAACAARAHSAFRWDEHARASLDLYYDAPSERGRLPDVTELAAQ